MGAELHGSRGPAQHTGLRRSAGHPDHDGSPQRHWALTHDEPIRPATASSPAEALALLCEALSDGDIEAALSLYEPGAIVVLAPRDPLGEECTSVDAIKFLANAKLVFEASPQRELLAGDVALLLARRAVAGTKPNGALVDDTGQGAAVLRNSPSQGWRFVLDYWCIQALAPAPLPEPAHRP